MAAAGSLLLCGLVPGRFPGGGRYLASGLAGSQRVFAAKTRRMGWGGYAGLLPGLGEFEQLSKTLPPGFGQ